jgi:hypothetical protein
LSRSELESLIRQPCHYCGAEYSNVNRTNARSELKYNGIDRVRNEIGYRPDNVVPCCAACNQAKRTSSKEDFIAWASRIASRRAEGLI